LAVARPLARERLALGATHLERGVGLGPADGVRDLLLGRERHVERELWRGGNVSVAAGPGRERRLCTCGGMIIMLGVTP